VDDGGFDVLGDAHEGRLERLRRVEPPLWGRRGAAGARQEDGVDPKARAEKGEKDADRKGDADGSRHHQERLGTWIAALAE
jgi:hypothetical protein